MIMDEVAQQVLLQSVFDSLKVMVLATARPFGLTMTFMAFGWAHLNIGVLRMVFAIAVALPVAMPLISVQQSHLPDLPYPYVFVLVKEIFIGGLFGWVASLPFAIAASSGHIIDAYRGGTSGDPDPGGGQITPYAKLFLVMSLFLFASLNGFWILTDTIYSTYAVWPMFDALPLQRGFEPFAIFMVLEALVSSALVIAAPLLLLMFATDLIFLLATKFGKQINVSHLAFSVKNVVSLIMLPIMCLILIRLFKGELTHIYDVDKLLKGLLP